MEEDRDGMSQDDVIAFNLYKYTRTGEWWNIVKMYEEQKFSAIYARINSTGDTALHVAVSIAPEEIAQQLIHVITLHSEPSLRLTNYEGNTPLHVAASAGRLNICILLANVDVFSAVQNLEVHQDPFRNKLGETPLFLAAFHGYKPIFLYLHSLLLEPFEKDLDFVNPAYRRNDGETALHCAIRWEYFDVAFEILAKEPNLAYSMNELGITPLHLLANKPSVFKSGSHLGWWKSIIYHCIHVEELEHETAHKDLIDSVVKELHESSDKDNITDKFPKNYQTCIQFYQMLKNMAQLAFGSKNINCKGWKADEESASERDIIGQSQKGYQAQSKVQKHHFLRSRYAVCFNIFHLLYTIFIRIILSLGYEGIRTIKRKHVHSAKIVEILIEETAKEDFINFKTGTYLWRTAEVQSSLPDSDWITFLKDVQVEETSEQGKGETPETTKIETHLMRTETPMLLAAGNGIIEMVEQILNKFSLATRDKREDKDILLSAMINRQTRVLQLLLKHDFVKHKLIHELDIRDNNALHLAAKLGKQKPWLIPGAALQMQWEIKWYEFVKDRVPQHFRYQVNQEGMTPEDTFNREHEQLVKEGGEWLNKTSESCSLVAALIATVAFAASTTIPGDINDKSGIPNLENQPAVTIFAISSLIALCFSITALFSFLAILTSRYEQKDFRRNLPMKLLIGLTSLFVSIASMLVSFCAGHYFTLKNKLKDKAFPVYAMTCLPIVYFAIQQLPLYLDIIWAIYKTVPRSSYKVVSL